MGRRQGALGLTSPWRRVGSGEYDTAGCGPEQVSPPPELELTETAKGPSTESFFSPRGGPAPFGPLSDPDGGAFTCFTGSNWSSVIFPASSNTKRKKLLKAEKPVKLDGCASYSGPEGLSDCLCDRIEG